MDELIISILLALLVGALSAMVAGFYAYKRGTDQGIEKGVADEQRKQEQLVHSAENQAARLVSEAENQSTRLVSEAEAKVVRIVSEAEAEAKQQLLLVKEEEVRLRNEVEAEQTKRRRESDRLEARLQDRLDGLDRRQQQVENRDRKQNQRESKLDQREQKLDQRNSQLDEKAKQIAQLDEERLAELERVAQLSQEEAKQELLEKVEVTAQQEMAKTVRAVEAQTAEEADRRAREIITLAIERVASEHISEYAISSVSLPSDEMKGRIIGRQGRNIRAIEQAIGVDLVVDDTPEAIIISCFDPVRREVARMALSKLVTDGRIHPSRIEAEIERAQREIEQVIEESGEQAIIETGTQGIHREIRKLVGRLKFRTSYGQNQLYHAIETAHIAAIMASELHADVNVARLGGLLHDIGKAVTHEIDGPHAIVGAEIAKRYGINDAVVNCIASHHGEVEPLSIEAVIVAAADAISGARPGARRESLETYIKRVSALEEIGNSFEGVSHTYAIQAGREIRVLVRPETIDDMSSINLSKDIAQKIEDNLQYPGQIRVTVIRETRSVEYAK